MNLDPMDIKLKFVRGFADKTRLQILYCIKEEEKTVSQIVDEIQGNQSNISQHLACLKGCGIISGRTEGRYIYYALSSSQIAELLNMFDIVLAHVQEDVCNCHRNERCVESGGESNDK